MTRPDDGDDGSDAKELSPEENADLCRGCVACCTYITVEVDAPRAAWEYDQWIWALHHEGIEMYVERPEHWFLHVQFWDPQRVTTEEDHDAGHAADPGADLAVLQRRRVARSGRGLATGVAAGRLDRVGRRPAAQRLLGRRRPEGIVLAQPGSARLSRRGAGRSRLSSLHRGTSPTLLW